MKNFNIRYWNYNSGHNTHKNNIIDPAQTNYTITGLQPDTYYSFSVRAVNWNVESSPYAPYVSATTLPPGNKLCDGDLIA